MKKHFLYWLVLGLVTIVACQKETSFESGGSPSDGTLQADGTGDCLPKTVNGAYLANTVLVAATNTLTVQVNVNQTGTYQITTDTVNGYYFRTSGVFTSTGPTNVILRGNGTPFTAGVDNFVVNYDSTQCDIAVTVLPAGTGNAVFTLEGAGGTCTGSAVAGTYATGTALNPAVNNVALTVNVTTIGTYTITTTYQGMTFTGSGAFTTTGLNTVVLPGTGTPTTGGANVVPITVGAGSCTLTINVGSPATGTLAGGPGACTPATVAGTYIVGTALNNSNTVQVQINATNAGPYTISTNTVAGMSFAASGTATLGNQTITLQGTGTPTAAGTQNFTVTFGTSSCTFSITVVAAGGAAVAILAGSPNACAPITVGGTYNIGTALTGSNTVQVQLNVTTAGTWTITSNSVAGFSFSGNGNVAVGNQTVTLNGTGTPTTAGAHVFTVTYGAGSTCTFTVNAAAAAPLEYFPRTVGSNWSYEIDDHPNDSLYRYVIAGTKTVSGNIYNIFMSNDGSGADSSGYYRKSGGDYIEWIDMGGYIGMDPPAIWMDYTFLKDNVAVGSSWNSAQFTGNINLPPPTPFTLRLKYTIDQKDVTVPIATGPGVGTTVSYPNVIVVKEEIEQFNGTAWINITSAIGYGKSYYARGIGFIQYIAFDGSGGEVYRMEMRRHQVVP